MSTPVRSLTSTSRPPTCASCGTATISRARQVESIAHCTHCDEDVCWLDGIFLVHHRRCAACQVLVGAAHATAYLIDGLCPACSRWLAKGLPVDKEELLEELAVGG